VRHSISLALAVGLALSVPARAQETAKSGRGFNPKISLILQGTYADYSSMLEPEVGGVILGPETELRPAGFSLSETELVVESNVDDQFHGWATVALENEDGETVVAVEEAYLNTLALPGGFAIKAGRFFSDIGYQNRLHSHAWEFVDMPLVYRTLLANQVNDDGVQLRWVAPTDLFLEIGAEALRGQEFPAGGPVRDGINSATGFIHLGGDAGVGGSWRVGLSHLAADAAGRETGEEGSPEVFTFTGDSGVSILDLVFKWAQDGNPAKRNVVFNAEYFHRKEDGTVDFTDDVTSASSAYDGKQRGFYAQGIFQFVPRWRFGARYDRLSSDNSVPGNTGEFDTLADNSYDPQRVSAMVDFSNSEFSRVRLQYNRDESRPADEKDNQWFLQYVMSLGSHPAHQF
jgi:hypothetical protein